VNCTSPRWYYPDRVQRVRYNILSAAATGSSPSACRLCSFLVS